jgi:hypothetical protein
MFVLPRLIVLFVIVAAGISMLAGSATAMTMDQIRAECRKEHGATGNAGSGKKDDLTNGRTNIVFQQVEYCVQQKMRLRGKK